MTIKNNQKNNNDNGNDDSTGDNNHVNDVHVQKVTNCDNRPMAFV